MVNSGNGVAGIASPISLSGSKIESTCPLETFSDLLIVRLPKWISPASSNLTIALRDNSVALERATSILSPDNSSEIST